MEPGARRVVEAIVTHPARVYLAVAALSGASLVALTLALERGNRPTDTELDLLRWFVDLPEPVRAVGEAVMNIAEVPVVLAVTVALLVAGMRRQALVVLVCSALARIGYELLKDLVSRPRPSVAAVGHPLMHGEDSFAFPSGHVTVATTLAFATMALLLPRAAPLVTVVVAALTALGRLSLGAHWPLDVVGGFLLGVFVVSVVLAIAGRWAVGGADDGPPEPDPPADPERPERP